jgi:hypothetical protein
VRSSILVVVLSTALAACGASSGGDTKIGDSCDAKNKCSDGQVCDLTDPKGASCIDADGDLDGDGIPNSMDKCDHMPGGLYDEDGDGIGDECDACPIAPPPATPDTDNDGVDAPCDPNPDTDGDKIVLFDGFNGTAIPTGWTASSAAWQITGGEAIMTPSDPATVETLAGPLSLATSHTVLFTAFRVDSVAAGANDVGAAVTGITKLPMGNSSAECGGTRDSGGDQVALETDAGSNSKVFLKGLFDPAGLYNVLEQLNGGTANCALIAPAESGAVQTNTAGNALNAAGVTAHGAKTRFEFLLVVQHP